MAVSPGFLASYVNLADLYRLQDREEEAEAVLVEALARDPGNPEIEHALGLTLARRQRLEEALPYLRRSAEGRPESARFAYVYGIALNSSGRGEEAVEVLETARKRHPDDADILFALATLERDRGNLPAARRHAGQLVDVRPEDAQARALLEMLSGN
jgi:tetratricopeptide (TPR) repeat protein